ncbi:MAG: TolC family protein [Paludibacteraceae bacterium]
MKKKNLILFVCVILFATVKGQQKQDTVQITLAQAIDIAMSESPTIKIADKEIERVDYSKKSAWYALIPNVEGSARYSKYLAPAKTSMFGTIMDSPTDFNTTLGLSLSLPLYAPALWHSIKLTTIEMQAATENANASRINLRNEVTKAYYNVLVAQDSYTVLKDGYDVAKKNYEVAKKGYEVGTLAAYDYISAEVQVNNLLPTILQTENGIEQAKTYLKILMGIDFATPINVVGNLSYYKDQVVAMNKVEDISLENNSDLKQLDISRLQVQRSLKLQQSQRLPTLAAFSQYGYAGTVAKSYSLKFGELPVTVPALNEWLSSGLVVGLTLNVPLTGILTNIPKEKKIKIQDEELVYQREQTKNSLQMQALSTMDRMNKTVKQVDAASKSIELAQKAYTISSKRYENGAGTMIELQNASLAITQSRLSYHQAIADYLTAKSDLEKILGEKTN